MRILDKNTDFYDYLQGVYRDDRFTFDRRDSFLLTKDMVCSKLVIDEYYSLVARKRLVKTQYFMLMQVCNTFWLFLLNVIALNSEKNIFWSVAKSTNYTLSLVDVWKDYSKKRVLISVNMIDFSYGVERQIFDSTTGMYNLSPENITLIRKLLYTGDFKYSTSLTTHTVYTDKRGRTVESKKNVPILKACGIGNCVNALDIYTSFEEYFSQEKTASERTEPFGATNNDKIESHGFDLKNSFRGNWRKVD